MIILTSNGLSSSSLISETKKYINNEFKSAVIITTASVQYKENDWHIPKLTNELNELNLSVEYFDFDNQPIELLQKYDVIMLLGGNPYYLLKQMRLCNCRPFFKEFIKDKILLGISAGSLVLQSSIELINTYTPEMNDNVGLTYFTGLNLVNIQILPHYSKYIKKYESFEQKAQDYEQKNNIHLIRINDGQAVFIDENNTYVI